MYSVEDATRFYLSSYISPSERLVSSTNIQTNWWANLFGDRMNKISGIYEIVNTINGHRYVGSTVDLRGRMKKHLLDLKRGNHHSQYLQRAWNTYGEDAFEFNILVCIPDPSIRYYEQIFINEENPSYNVFPFAKGGSVVGHTVVQETRNKLSQTSKGNQNCLGLKNAQGYKHTEDAKHRISVNMRGKQNSLGHKQTPEHKSNISKSLVGHTGYWEGKHLSDEHRQAVSDSLVGRVFSDEHKQHLRDAWDRVRQRKLEGGLIDKR